jgi:hypothetical protein
MPVKTHLSSLDRHVKAELKITTGRFEWGKVQSGKGAILPVVTSVSGAGTSQRILPDLRGGKGQ